MLAFLYTLPGVVWPCLQDGPSLVKNFVWQEMTLRGLWVKSICLSALLSAATGIIIGFFADGGYVAQAGFISSWYCLADYNAHSLHFCKEEKTYQFTGS